LKNIALKRNLERFPVDFMFKLTQEEWTLLRSQIVTLKTGQGKHSKYLPYAFTELGVSMLSSVLNSQSAIQINIKIMRAFVYVRQLVLCKPADRTAQQLQTEVRALRTYIEDVISEQKDVNEDTRSQLEAINQALAELQSQKETTADRLQIGYTAPQYR
jgi:hypothetical protein